MTVKECCLSQTEGKSGTKFENDDQKFDVPSHLWSPFLLEFSNQSKERQFRRVCYPSWLAQDLAGHSIGVIIGPAFVYSLHSELPRWYSALWLVNSLGFAHANVHVFFRHRQEQIENLLVAMLCLKGISMRGGVSGRSCLCAWGSIYAWLR